MAFNRPSLPELIQRIDQDLLSRLPGSQAALAHRVTRALTTAVAGVAHGLYGYLQWLERQLFPETCDDDLLYLHSAGVPRRLAAKAEGRVTFTGSEGAAVIKGTRLRVDEHEYATREDVFIVDGFAVVGVEAISAGAVGDQNAGQKLSLVSPISGVQSAVVVGVDGLQGGADIEAPDSWRDRILVRRARIPRGGAAGDWTEWALQVPGVTRAWEDPRGMGPGTVVIRVMADSAADGPLPSPQLLDDVVAHISAEKNVGAHLYVIAPTPVHLQPQIAVSPDTAEVRAAIEANLQDLVLLEGQPGGTLLISRIRHAISSAPGVRDYRMTAPTTDIAHDTGELPVWGGVTWQNI